MFIGDIGLMGVVGGMAKVMHDILLDSTKTFVVAYSLLF
jgi:hypothetical protein